MDKNTGWMCPRCKKVHAPWVEECICTEIDVKNDTETKCPHSWIRIGELTRGFVLITVWECEYCHAKRTEQKTVVKL